jgi:hypothetical protein
VAAVIVLTDDEKLAAKKRETNDDGFSLLKQQRVQLCRATFTQDWVWVYEGSEDSWKDTQISLVENTQRDGIQLKWIMLGGPDWFTTQQVCNPTEWGCLDAITSNVSRPVDFCRPFQMLKLPSCGEWESPRIDYLRLERQVQARMRGQLEKGASQALKASIKLGLTQQFRYRSSRRTVTSKGQSGIGVQENQVQGLYSVRAMQHDQCKSDPKLDGYPTSRDGW